MKEPGKACFRELKEGKDISPFLFFYIFFCTLAQPSLICNDRQIGPGCG